MDHRAAIHETNDTSCCVVPSPFAAGAATSMQVCRFLARERSDEHSFGTAVEQFVMFDALRVAGAGMRYMHDRDCAAFERTQRTLLRDLLRQNAETAYGRAHGFGALATSEDVVGAYRRRMPLATYADVEPYVKRIEAGRGKCAERGRRDHARAHERHVGPRGAPADDGRDVVDVLRPRYPCGLRRAGAARLPRPSPALVQVGLPGDAALHGPRPARRAELVGAAGS